MDITGQIKSDLKECIDSDKARVLPRFFQAFPGGYGEGDIFLGVSVPNQRRIARKYYKEINLPETEGLLKQPVHEYRLTALFILVDKFEKIKDEETKRKIVKLYLKNTDYINNWDLVDSSAYKIPGAWLYDKNRDILYKMAASNHLWQQRIAIIATYNFIKKDDFKDTLNIAALFLTHNHDLIHKAVGWMLREVGKRNFETEYDFLIKHYEKMPRTMLRYAIEKFDGNLRKKFLNGEL